MKNAVSIKKFEKLNSIYPLELMGQIFFSDKSFPKRKRYYNHKFNGKCTIEPRWIRWHKNHKRVECAHHDCTHKLNIDYTYPGLMKHIIECHTVQEDSVS